MRRMSIGMGQSLIGALLSLVLLTLSGQPAHARNVPGSAAIPLSELSQSASATLIGGVHRGLLRARGEARDAKSSDNSIFAAVSSQDQAPHAFGMNVGFVAAGGVGLAVNFGYRNIDDDGELDYDLITGSALGLYQLNPDLMLFGGLVMEDGDGDTEFNSGTLSATGFGGAAGFDYRLNDRVYLNATAAFLSLDYDFTRSDGVISGSFDATRYLIDFSADYAGQSGNIATDLSLGLRYIHQDNDSYTESGGAAVDSSSSNSLSGVLGGRARLLRPVLQPFVEAELRYDLVDDFDLPGGVPVFDEERTNLRIGGGLLATTGTAQFEAGLGVHATENGYNGFDARLRIVIQF